MAAVAMLSVTAPVTMRTSACLGEATNVMPKRSTGFLELYREIVLGMPFEFLGDQLGKLSTGANSLTSHPIFRRTPGIVNALLAMKSGDFERTNIAMQWLTGKAGLSTADLKAIGVTYKINSPEEAIDSLSTLTSLATYRNNPPKKIVLMIDEYQRVGELSPRLSKENNAGLHTFFNQNPDGLELILSFSFGREDDIAFLLSDELKSRAEPQAITLDVLTRAQASEFLSDLLAKFRITKDERWAFPFSPLAINAMLMQISQLKDLTPRRIMKYANHILMEHILDNPKSSEEISDSEVLSYLEDPQLSSLDVDSDSDIASD